MTLPTPSFAPLITLSLFACVGLQANVSVYVDKASFDAALSATGATADVVAALFFGIVDDSASFTEASISVGDIGTGLGDYDDISFSVVPEPSAFALLATLSAAVLLGRRR